VQDYSNIEIKEKNIVESIKTQDNNFLVDETKQEEVEVSYEETKENIEATNQDTFQYQEPVYVQEDNTNYEQVETVIQEKEEIIVEEPIIENSLVEQEIIEETQIEKTEEYRYNAEMTQRMIDMINNNPNENMLEYGYEIVVDSSAKENSNPFTYTDERLLIKIQRRCGTIHVYAEDYYLNGNYFGTDCYIF